MLTKLCQKMNVKHNWFESHTCLKTPKKDATCMWEISMRTQPKMSLDKFLGSLEKLSQLDL